MKTTGIKLKNILVAVLCVVFALTLFACNYNPATGKPSGSGSSSSGGGSSSGGSQGGDSDIDSDVFTVRLDTTIAYAYLSNIQVIWTDTESRNGAYASAYFDRNGVATATGLDGNYKVTLSAAPEGYTYNPNEYTASNDSRDVTIRLYKLSNIDNLGATGSDWYYDVCRITTTGVYRAVLTEDNYEEGVRFMYAPQINGRYSIESIIDTTQNKLNPLLGAFYGTSAFINDNSGSIIDGGSEYSNTYTKNFRWERQIEVGGEGNVIAFRIYATSVDKDIFPLTVDFIVDRDGEVTGSSNRGTVIKVKSEHNFEALEGIAFSDATSKIKDFGNYGDNNGLLNGSNVKYAGDEVNDAAHDYYYVDLGNGNRKILYAAISVDNEVIQTDTKSGFLDDKNSPKFLGETQNGKTLLYNYVAEGFISTYAAHAQNGYYPVTNELQLFLQRFSVAKRLFNDGDGYGETKYMSSDSNQWLFACYVYI